MVILYLLTCEEGFEAAASILRVVLLSVECGADGMRLHHVVGHRPPRVIWGRGLGLPHVSGVAGQVALLKSLYEASRSTIAPRAVLTSQAPLFMLKSVSRSKSPSVSGVGVLR